MGRIDEVERAQMMELLLREKQSRADLETAREEAAKWRERVELASRHQEAELLAQARERLEATEQAMAAANHELEVIAQEKSVLRHAANLPEGHDTAAAEALLDDFRAMDVHPEEAELREVAREQSAVDMLAALKKKMGDGGP